MILGSSLVARWPYSFAPTLEHYRFDAIGGYTALVNSVQVAALTAVVGTAAVSTGAYLVEKCRTPASHPLSVLALLRGVTPAHPGLDGPRAGAGGLSPGRGGPLWLLALRPPTAVGCQMQMVSEGARR